MFSFVMHMLLSEVLIECIHQTVKYWNECSQSHLIELEDSHPDRCSPYSVHNTTFHNIHHIFAVVLQLSFSCFWRLLLWYSSHDCKFGAWCVNNEGIMWNGFLPRWEPGEQWSHKRGFVLPEFQSRHFAVRLGLSSCGGQCSLHQWWQAFEALLRVTGMRPRLAFSTGDAFPILNPHWHWTHGFGVTSLTLIDFSSHILLTITYMRYESMILTDEAT